MYVKVNRDLCHAHLAVCERCMGRFLQFPMGYERHCFEYIEDDGKEAVTLVLHTGSNDVTLVLDDEQRQMVAREGWTAFVDFAVPMYRNHTA